MTNPSNSAIQNLLPVQAYFNLDGSFNTFIGQGVPFYATTNPIQSGLTITNSTINSSVIGGSVPDSGTFTNIATNTGTISTNASNSTDIVNFLTLQAYAAGISWKNPVTAATTANITLSGLQTVDSVSLVAGNTVLVKNQTDNTKNGIYQVNIGTWTYATGSTTWAQYVSALVFVEYGTQQGSAWYCTAQPGGTLGTTAMVWSQFSVSTLYSAGTGLTLTGYQFSITNTGVAATTYGSATATPVFAVNAQGQITSVTNTTITPAIGNVTGLGTNMLAFLQTPTSANLAATVTDETGTGALVFATSPTFVTPALGTPASGVVTNLTGTASININGSVGATTRYTGDFTSISGNTTTNTTPVLSFNATNTIASFGTTTASSYNQLIIQNKSGTAGASTNYVISNDIGTDSTYYGEFGMNSSVFSASTPADFFSINNGVYFSGHDGDVSVGSGNGYKTYLAWGTAGQSAHVINATGAIGLSTNLGTTPAGSGTTGFGTSGQVLTSQGSSSAPTWTTPITSVSGTLPISVATGTTTPIISISQSTTSTNGYLSSTDWNTFNGKQSALVSGTNIKTVNGTSLLGSGDVGTITVPYGGTGLTSLTAGYIPYGNGTSAFSSSANLTFNGTTLTIANDASISGLTVGRGAGPISTNTAFGANAVYSNTTGANSTGLGYQALVLQTTGINNTAVGSGANRTNATGSENSALGLYALYNNTASYNTAIGSTALFSNTTASGNTAVGYQAAYSNTTATDLVAIGYQALYSNTGNDNTAVGYFALKANTSGIQNVSMGAFAAQNSTSSNNTCAGYGALSSQTSGGSNTAVGYLAANNLTTGGGNTYFGAGVAASSGTVASELVVGTPGATGKGTNTGFIYAGGGGVYQGNNSTLWSITSDQRLKKNIVNNTDGLNKITAIQVRNFEYRTKDEVTELEPQNAINIQGVQLGAIAQELQAILPECVKTESTGVMSVDASNLTWYLINAIQELNTKVTALEAQLEK